MTARRHRPDVVVEPRNGDLALAASIYAVSEQTIRDLIEHENFPHLRVGNRIVIPLAAADAWWVARATGGAAA